MIITVDIDTHNHFQFLKAYYNLNHIVTLKGDKSEVVVHLTRKGYHLTAFLDGVSREQVLKIRALCGDDADRLFMDKRRIKKWSFGALFQVRRGRPNEILLACFSSDNPF